MLFRLQTRCRKMSDTEEVDKEVDKEVEKEVEKEVDKEENTEEQDGDESLEDDSDDSEFDDPEGYIDDIADEELLGDLLKDKPVEETGYDNIIVVDNAPKVGPDRMTKLQSVLTKVFGRFGKIVSQDYPIDDSGTFKGYFFLEFSTPEEAANAVKTGNGYRLDKAHIFKVNFFSDFEKYANVPEKWEPPVVTPFQEVGNLRSWLLEDNCYDQVSVLHNQGQKVAIVQCTPQELKMVQERENWTEKYVSWSPLGSYLATLHTPGVALWGTATFSRIRKFEHSKVQNIDFSPCERYLMTFSAVVDDPNDPQNIYVWDVKTGMKKRTFRRGSGDDWPMLKWSHDSKYVARMSENLLSVFEVPSFTLLDKKSIVAKGIRDFSWSPTDNLIAYWVPGRESIPAKIIIFEVPSRKEICTKSRHDVKECRLQWHKQGNYLCVKVDHYITKKQECCSFEIFHMREPDIPVDTIEIKEQVLAFSMEPHGARFCAIHGEPPTRISASFYAIKDKGNKLVKITTLERRTSNTIFWSPAGQFVVLAGLKGMDGQLEFYDTGDMSLMNSVEHTMATDLKWDPTGRYVVTSVSAWNQKADTGFYVWSFQGKPLYRNPNYMEKFCEFLWRPRPSTLLTEQDIKAIRKDYKKYHHMFEQRDKTIRTKASKDLIEKRRRSMETYREYRRKKDKEFKQRSKMSSQNSADEEEDEEEEEDILFVSEDVEYIQSKTA